MATNTTCTVSLLPFGYVVTPGTSSFVGSLWLDDCGNVDVIGLQFRY